jgi:hypothetical protein
VIAGPGEGDVAVKGSGDCAFAFDRDIIAAKAQVKMRALRWSKTTSWQKSRGYLKIVRCHGETSCFGVGGDNEPTAPLKHRDANIDRRPMA